MSKIDGTYGTYISYWKLSKLNILYTILKKEMNEKVIFICMRQISLSLDGLEARFPFCFRPFDSLHFSHKSLA